MTQIRRDPAGTLILSRPPASPWGKEGPMASDLQGSPTPASEAPKRESSGDSKPRTKKRVAGSSMEISAARLVVVRITRLSRRTS